MTWSCPMWHRAPSFCNWYVYVRAHFSKMNEFKGAVVDLLHLYGHLWSHNIPINYFWIIASLFTLHVFAVYLMHIVLHSKTNHLLSAGWLYLCFVCIFLSLSAVGFVWSVPYSWRPAHCAVKTFRHESDSSLMCPDIGSHGQGRRFPKLPPYPVPSKKSPPDRFKMVAQFHGGRLQWRRPWQGELDRSFSCGMHISKKASWKETYQ